MRDNKNVKTASGINIAAGIWLVLAPFIFGFMTTTVVTNFILVGIAVALLAAIRIGAREDMPWLSWMNMVLGVWLILSAFIFNYAEPAAMSNSIVAGMVIVLMSVWSASETKQTA